MLKFACKLYSMQKQLMLDFREHVKHMLLHKTRPAKLCTK